MNHDWSDRMYRGLLRMWIRENKVPKKKRDQPLIDRITNAMSYVVKRRRLSPSGKRRPTRRKTDERRPTERD